MLTSVICVPGSSFCTSTPVAVRLCCEIALARCNFVTFEAESEKGVFNLTKKEAMLLKLLIDRKNEVVSRQQILQAVWGYDVYPSTRTIDNFILSFRKKFERDPKHPTFFLSVRGVGYKFVSEK